MSNIKNIVNKVLLNYEAQKEWADNMDPDFVAAVEVVIRRYIKSEWTELDKAQIFRTGVMLGAIYEKWRQSGLNSHTRG